jgi:hypothetical protein
MHKETSDMIEAACQAASFSRTFYAHMTRGSGRVGAAVPQQPGPDPPVPPDIPTDRGHLFQANHGVLVGTKGAYTGIILMKRGLTGCGETGFGLKSTG